MTTRSALSVRVNHANPNHHIWNNHGTWWCHFSVHLPDYTAERKRVSLKTNDVTVARFLRDSLLQEFSADSVAAI